MKFGCDVLHINMHRLTELDFQFGIIFQNGWPYGSC